MTKHQAPKDFERPPSRVVEHPDSELLRLDVRLSKAHALRDKFAVECDRAYDRFKPPAYGRAVVWHKRDAANVWPSPDKLDGIGSAADERFTYASGGALDVLKARLGSWETSHNQYDIPERDLIRIKSIIAGVEAWEVEEDRRLEACGYKAADRGFNDQHNIITDLARQIAAMTARTAEGVCVKARALSAVSLKSVDLLEEHRFADLLAKRDLDVEEQEELLTLSLMIDAARLVGKVVDPLPSGTLQAAA